MSTFSLDISTPLILCYTRSILFIMVGRIFNRFAKGIRKGWIQYPILFLLSAINFLMLMILQHYTWEEPQSKDILTASLKTGFILVPIVFSFEYLISFKNRLLGWLLLILIVLAGTIWFFQYQVPTQGVYEPYYLISFASLSLLIGVVSPLLLKLSPVAYWHYLQKLILSFATSILFVGIIYLALVLAFQALELLFGIQQTVISEYDIASLSFTSLHTLVFVSLFSLKDGFYKEQGEMIWPFLKTLAQAVFLPIASLYMFILYAYAIRIMIISEWPRGWITNLVFGLAIVGLGSFAILYPYLIRNENGSENADQSPWWINWFKKYFFASMIPLSILQLMSIGIRIDEYGWTIPRYIVVAIGLYVLVACVYIVISKGKDLRVLALIFGGFFLVAAFSPFNALQASKQSIQNSIKEQLLKIDPESDGVFPEKGVNVTIPDSLGKVLSDKTSFMVEEYGIQTLSHFLSDSCAQHILKDSDFNSKIQLEVLFQDLSQCTAIDFITLKQYSENQLNQHFYLSSNQYNAVQRTDISNFSHSYRFNVSSTSDASEISISNTSDNILAIERLDGSKIEVNLNLWIEHIPVNLTEIFELKNEYKEWDTYAKDGTPIRIVFNKIDGYYRHREVIITELEGVLYE